VQEDIPAECARKLLEDEVDLALVPVAILTALKEYHIVTDYCIGADGQVDSVKLYSAVPLEEVKSVLLDYQSRTSVNLARLLFSRHWKMSPAFVAAKEGFEQAIGGTTAGVVIGDRTFSLNGKFLYEYDLAAEWKLLTGLPFVFAAWVSRRKLPESFINRFNAVLKSGIDGIDEALEQCHYSPRLDRATAREYLTQRIDYQLDDKKKRALELFLQWINELNY
jgi:chorismate dehydratase